MFSYIFNLPTNDNKTDDNYINELISQLKTKLNSDNPEYLSYFTETAFRRFIIARKLNVDDAYKAMINYITWRKSKNVDSIKTTDFQTESKKKLLFKIITH